MHRYVAFLRGMNLGRRRIKNPELCAAFEKMGFKNVSAFLASGNIVFDTDATDADAVAASIETGLNDSLGYDVPTFLRTADEVNAIAAHTPFADFEGGNRIKMQVVMFSDAVDESARAAVLGLSNDEDRLELASRELYWMPDGNFLDSQLDLKAIERIIGPFTIRTKNTMERLAAKFLAG